MRWGIFAAVTVPPLVLAAIGVTHPHHLGADTADWWVAMHVILLPIFPLLGLALWLLVREPGPTDRPTRALAVAAGVAAFLYAAFYSGLDAVAGIAGGTLVGRGFAAAPLREVASLLGAVGTWSFLAGSVLTAVVVLRRAGPRALPGGLILVVAAVSYLNSHIYFPRGVVTMLAFALAFGLLARAGAAATA